MEETAVKLRSVETSGAALDVAEKDRYVGIDCEMVGLFRYHASRPVLEDTTKETRG